MLIQDLDQLKRILNGDDTVTDTTFDELLAAATRFEFPFIFYMKGGDELGGYIYFSPDRPHLVTFRPFGEYRTRILERSSILGISVGAFC